MTWSEQKARKRIKKSLASAPKVNLRRYADEYLPEYRKRRQLLAEAGATSTPPLFQLGQDQAVLVQTVQIYVAITNYDEFRLSEGVETEDSHQRALEALHLYYSVNDRVADHTAISRVDFHGARMHAVILDETGQISRQSVAKAFEYVRLLQSVADDASRMFSKIGLQARFRVGIDAGQCVAINNGSGSEQEPLFLGSAANHAAKLADGEEAGVFVSDNIRRILELSPIEEAQFSKQIAEDRFLSVASEFQQNGTTMLSSGISARDQIINKWQSDLKVGLADLVRPEFRFQHRCPPLREVRFRDLSPSKSIRMPLVSLFADIDGFTRYIDGCRSPEEVSNAVRALFVVRQEMKAVVEDDLGGKKVRFIGDCIHGLLAEGTSASTDPQKTVTSAAKCAAALLGSFEICKTEIEGIGALGLAIGLEYGPTPVSKIGIRGERAVRIASSKATTLSEDLQRTCDAGQVRFGQTAIAVMDAGLRDLIDPSGFSTGVDYDDIAVAVQDVAVAAPAVVIPRVREFEAPPPPRSHFKA